MLVCWEGNNEGLEVADKNLFEMLNTEVFSVTELEESYETDAVSGMMVNSVVTVSFPDGATHKVDSDLVAAIVNGEYWLSRRDEIEERMGLVMGDDELSSGLSVGEEGQAYAKVVAGLLAKEHPAMSEEYASTDSEKLLESFTPELDAKAAAAMRKMGFSTERIETAIKEASPRAAAQESVDFDRYARNAAQGRASGKAR